MHTQIRFPVAASVFSPHSLSQPGIHVLDLDYRFRDMHVTLHGAIVGADTAGRYTLLDNIVTAAQTANIQVDCVAPADWPTPILADTVTTAWRGAATINDATARYHQDVQRRNSGEPPLLIVVDCAELVFHDDRRHDTWATIALLGATRNVSILAVAEDLSDSPLLPRFARGNLFHLRTPRHNAGELARAHLPGTRIEDLPAPAAWSYGYAYHPHADPTPFAVVHQQN